MDQLEELLKQIQEMAGIGVKALQKANGGGGGDSGPEPAGPHSEGPPPHEGPPPGPPGGGAPGGGKPY